MARRNVSFRLIRVRGFTIVELLVVIAIVGLLIALLLPAVQMAREAARRTQCSNNLRQLALACQTFEDSYKHFPPGGRYAEADEPLPHVVGGFGAGNDCHYDKGNWIVYCLPYMEHQALFESIPDLEYFNYSDPLDPRNNSIKAAEALGILPNSLDATLRCPSDEFSPNKNVSSYMASSGPQCTGRPTDADFANNIFYQYCDPLGSGLGELGYRASSPVGSRHNAQDIRGMFGRTGAVVTRAMCTDGTSNTILVGETKPLEHRWIEFPSGGPAGAGGVGPNNFDHANWASALSGNAAGITTIPINYYSGRPLGHPDFLHRHDNRHVAWGFKSGHVGGTQFAMVDGSTQFIIEQIDMITYQLIGCRNDAQPERLYRP